MPRVLMVALLFIACCGPLCAQGRGDALFRRYPFDTWRAEGNVTQIKWQFRVPEAALSAHQRLVQRLEILVGEDEIRKRRDHGQLVFLVEIEDPTGRKWRTRDIADLTPIPADVKAPEISWTQDVFVLPGTYKIAAAVVDAKTKEHSLVVREFRVQPVRSDRLPQAWNNLPAVEFARLYGLPDAWFQPYMRTSVAVPVESKRPVHVDVIMNMTLSERAQGSLRAFRRNMSLLIPSLRVLAGMKVAQGSMDVTLLDLARKKKWLQTDAHGLDWAKFREPLADTNPGVIDAQSLAGKAAMQQFFWDGILDRLKTEVPQGEDALRVVIVLSSPVFLEKQYKVEPATFPKDQNRRVYYVQYRPINARWAPIRSDVGAMPAAPPLPSDDLERTLKLLDSKVFSVISPEQFRKALATILADIARM